MSQGVFYNRGMSPAPSKYSIYHMNLLKGRKDNGIIKGLTKIEQKEGAG
jgi:hypothetical protein